MAKTAHAPLRSEVRRYAEQLFGKRRYETQAELQADYAELKVILHALAQRKSVLNSSHCR